MAYKQGLIQELPYRQKRTKITNRYFNYLLIKNSNEIFIEKRTAKDIWKNLYQLPLIETDKSVKKNFHTVIAKFLGTNTFAITSYSNEIVQLLSHRKIFFRFIEVEMADFKGLNLPGVEKVKLSLLPKFAFPKTIHLVLVQKRLI